MGDRAGRDKPEEKGQGRKEGAGPEGNGIPGAQTPAKEGRHPPAARSQHPVQLPMLPKKYIILPRALFSGAKFRALRRNSYLSNANRHP